MENNNFNLGTVIIPARGGSKRIPGKNIKPFAGRPAIHYPIEAALASGVVDQIIVSTDSKEIAECVKGIERVRIHFRPANLADDITPTVPVISEAILANNLDPLSPVCCVYPVNPFIVPSDIENGLELLKSNSDISYVNTICTYSYPIQRAVRKNTNNHIEMFNPELALTRSQDLEEAFHDAGQWYWGKANTWINGERLLFNSIGFPIPRWRCQDIDTLEDWETSEILYEVSRRKLQ
ncbi:MAG: pseudaminic acid cytidylyltransferase [Opitutaceae bacterium]